MGVEAVSQFLGSEEFQFSLGFEESPREEAVPAAAGGTMDELLPELEAIRAVLTEKIGGPQPDERG